ncbi:MAG: hypothetical protein A2X01_00700 [Bacteroidetes bacterium GWF2_35_48]|nr:MAG: hypothetical protein A2X01_00700 [Bacteroidetes bacterium GWF2_35_48]
MFESKPALPVGRAFAVLKTKEFTFVNDCFQHKSNRANNRWLFEPAGAMLGHYGQTLFKCIFNN